MIKYQYRGNIKKIITQGAFEDFVLKFKNFK